MTNTVPYVDQKMIQNFINARFIAKLDEWNSNANKWVKDKTFAPPQLRPASSVLIIDTCPEEKIDKAIEHLKRINSLSMPLIACLSLESALEYKKFKKSEPDIILYTTSEVSFAGVEEFKTSTFLVPIATSPFPFRKIKRIANYCLPYLDTNLRQKIKEDNLAVTTIPTYDDPVSTMVMLLILYRMINFYFVDPLPFTFISHRNFNIPVRGIAKPPHKFNEVYTHISAIISNTLFKTWLSYYKNMKGLGLTLLLPDGNIFGYDENKIKKDFSL